jgi:cell division GTPase FtsZ
MLDAFASIDSYFGEAIECFIELLRPGLIDIGVLDLLDLAGGFCEGSIAVGRGAGENMATEAVEAALADRTFKFKKARASVVLMKITSGPEMKTCDLSRLVSPVQAALGSESSLVYSHQVLNDMMGKIKATLVFLCPRSR